jgi:hypothetical protein
MNFVNISILEICIDCLPFVSPASLILLVLLSDSIVNDFMEFERIE